MSAVLTSKKCIVCFQVTSGATSDLKHATQQARHMVMECGMSSEIGPVYIPEEKSAETRKLIDTEVTKILREAYSRVTLMLVRLEAWHPHFFNCRLTYFWSRAIAIHLMRFNLTV